MSIGTKIKAQRTYQNLSQKQLAEKVRMSEPAIRNYELGNRTPSAKQIELIAGALGVSPFALCDPDLDTDHGIIHSLFYLENTIGMHPIEVDGQIYLSVPSRSDTYERMEQWYRAYTKHSNGEMSDEEYKEWIDTYPEKEVYNTRAKRIKHS